MPACRTKDTRITFYRKIPILPAVVTKPVGSVCKNLTRDERQQCQQGALEAAMVWVYSLVIAIVLFLLAAVVDWLFPEP